MLTSFLVRIHVSISTNVITEQTDATVWEWLCTDDSYKLQYGRVRKHFPRNITKGTTVF